ncbi:hypothetical protein ACTJKH_17680 [Microbacterium sp. 22215]|uniref:hypothetical protein n=1 Tax=Microbacterium sp. 22215 TaxID=3453893 RepID=UPI003F8359B5
MSIWILVIAVVLTSITIAAVRFAWVDAQSISIQPPSQMLWGLVGTSLVFIIGGLPGAFVTNALASRERGEVVPFAAHLRFAFAGNAVSFLGGLVLLYFLIWEVDQRLLVLGGLAVMGTTTFLIALRIGSRMFDGA